MNNQFLRHESWNFFDTPRPYQSQNLLHSQNPRSSDQKYDHRSPAREGLVWLSTKCNETDPTSGRVKLWTRVCAHRCVLLKKCCRRPNHIFWHRMFNILIPTSNTYARRLIVLHRIFDICIYTQTLYNKDFVLFFVTPPALGWVGYDGVICRLHC